ncbi:MAG: hypothetical protein KDI98_10810 [Hyphomicrobiaceae bacterium]|nr:hypothetical protein [Hyphomicrobiaceae bacterium]
MTRLSVLMMIPFLWGSPQFADLRPQALDVPLVNYHMEMKSMMRDAVMMVETVGDFHRMEYLRPHLESLSRL